MLFDLPVLTLMFYRYTVRLEIYAGKCVEGKFFKEKYVRPDIKKVKNFLSKKLQDGDWYMKAEEAVYYGFADKVVKSI